MRSHIVGTVFASVTVALAVVSHLNAQPLTCDERVRAQEAIERVYYAHQIGATAPFGQAVPRAVLERKVRTYLAQSAALEAFWHTPVTAEMLRREMERQARESRLPERLRELWAALGDDPFLVQECLARPALVDRLVRAFYAAGVTPHSAPGQRYDDWWGEVRTSLSADSVPAVADPLAPLPPLSGSAGSGGPDAPPCLPDDTWHNGSLDLPDRRAGHTAVWTGSLMIVWGDRSNVYNNTGQRYDPATSSWTLVSRVNAPGFRTGHTSVWTGSVMIIWGGHLDYYGGYTNTGGRYYPLTDTWTPTTTTGAPTPRGSHSAVWTGSDMIVWGGEVWGSGAPTFTNSGSMYSPAADSWVPTATAGAPAARSGHGAVWTGSLMVVWGGGNPGFLRSGGRFDPAESSWTATSLTNAPTARGSFSTVWTGSHMVVWGGSDANGALLNTGGRYSPTANSWSTTTIAGAPSARQRHTAVWSGSRMIVWGGAEQTSLTNTGGRYDPVGDSWTPTATTGAPTAGDQHSAIWTGSQMIAWGGLAGPDPDDDVTNRGGRYDPVADTWTPTDISTAPGPRWKTTAVWTGNLMIVWGGGADDLGDGSRYDPALDHWSPTTPSGAPAPRSSHTAVWTGNVMVVWGGEQGSGSDTVRFNTGGRYDPISDSWSPTSTAGAPAARDNHTAVWTGTWMIVWGGTDPPTGGRYDPVGDSWSPVSTDGAPSARESHTATWAGGRMIVWGGDGNTGGRYDPVNNSWSPTSTDGAPSARGAHTAVWTGDRVVIWGGTFWDGSQTIRLNTGGRYDPVNDTWSPTATDGAPPGGTGHSAVWGGARMIIWGGNGPTNVGGRYDPVLNSWMSTSVEGVPTPREYHSAVWTGSDMIVWGGMSGHELDSGGIYALDHAVDNDGDGYSECIGDCNDLSAVSYPGAPEFCDGLDNDCDGSIDEGMAMPGGLTGLAAERVADAARLSWPALVTATTYDVVSGTAAMLRGSAGDFTAATDRCLANNLPRTTLDDVAVPAVTDAFWYLVRAVNCAVAGTYDTGGAGQSGLRDAEIGAAPAACP